VAQQTSGLTGAELANICNEAAIFAARRAGTTIGHEDFDNALERVVAGVQTNNDAEPARAAGRRLPRGRTRAVPRAAGDDRAHPQDLDRAPAGRRWATS